MKAKIILLLTAVFFAFLAAVFVASALAITPPLNSFTTGQVSPHLEGRTDFPKYNSGCRTLQNMVITAQGPVTKRPGTEYITDPNDTTVTVIRLIEFVYSTDDSYVLEFSNQGTEATGILRVMRTVNGTSGVIQE